MKLTRRGFLGAMGAAGVAAAMAAGCSSAGSAAGGSGAGSGSDAAASGATIVGRTFFGDHHRYRREEIALLERDARAAGASRVAVAVSAVLGALLAWLPRRLPAAGPAVRNIANRSY